MSEYAQIQDRIRMVAPCPECGGVVDGGQMVARCYPCDPWSHEACFDQRTAS